MEKSQINAPTPSAAPSNGIGDGSACDAPQADKTDFKNPALEGAAPDDSTSDDSMSDEPVADDPASQELEACLASLREGDTAVRGELLLLSQDRLRRLTAKMKQSFPGVARWEQTEDVLQNASLRLYESMAETPINDVRHFFRLAAVQIRRELIDLCRRHRGPMGFAKNHATQRPRDGESSPLEAMNFPAQQKDAFDTVMWTEFHRRVEALPDREREVFELVWYHELPQSEIAKMLDVSTRTVKRIFRNARMLLAQNLSSSKDHSAIG